MVILVRDFAERRDERLGLGCGVQEEPADGSGDWGGGCPIASSGSIEAIWGPNRDTIGYTLFLFKPHP